MTRAGTVAGNIGDDTESKPKGEIVMTRKWLRKSALSLVPTDRIFGTNIIVK